MRRDPLPLLLLLLLVILGAGAWLTREPNHPLWGRLAELPWVGQPIERFRQGYLAAPAGTPDPAPLVEYVVVGGEAPSEPIDLRPGAVAARPLGTVWVRAGAALRESPGAGAAVSETLPGLRSMTLLATRGDWRLVSRVGLEGAAVRGWVRRADITEPSRDELWRPDPVLPLAAAPPDEEVLALARELMAGAAREVPCGPFRLITDVAGPLIERCPRLAGQLDDLYARRTGLAPVSDPAGAIVLFDSHAAYLIFRDQVSPESRRHAFAAPARGFVALAAGGRLVAQIQATLVHELMHLLNRRHLGPALPPWLDEGLAEELAMSRIAADGGLAPGSLGRWEVAGDKVRLRGGGQVALDELRADLRRGDLPPLEDLVALDSGAFQAEDRFQMHYSLSAFWLRYLLSGEAPAGGDGVRSFLAAVAAGERLDDELLLAHLGGEWPDLEAGFRRWLDAEA